MAERAMVEDAGKRLRRWKREARHLAEFERSVARYRASGSLAARPIRPDVCACYSLYATWDSVRRVAAQVLRCIWIKDVPVAWAILYFVDKLPDGAARLRAAVESAVEQWHAEVDALAPPTTDPASAPPNPAPASDSGSTSITTLASRETIGPHASEEVR